MVLLIPVIWVCTPYATFVSVRTVCSDVHLPTAKWISKKYEFLKLYVIREMTKNNIFPAFTVAWTLVIWISSNLVWIVRRNTRLLVNEVLLQTFEECKCELNLHVSVLLNPINTFFQKVAAYDTLFWNGTKCHNTCTVQNQRSVPIWTLIVPNVYTLLVHDTIEARNFFSRKNSFWRVFWECIRACPAMISRVWWFLHFTFIQSREILQVVQKPKETRTQNEMYCPRKISNLVQAHCMLSVGPFMKCSITCWIASSPVRGLPFPTWWSIVPLPRKNADIFEYQSCMEEVLKRSTSWAALQSHRRSSKVFGQKFEPFLSSQRHNWKAESGAATSTGL